MEWLGLVLLGLVVGCVSGLMGIGGGIILVPLLLYLFGFTQKEAQGTSLGVLAFPVVVFAAVEYHRQGHVKLPVVGWIVLGFVVGAYFGALIVPYVPGEWLSRGFGALLLYTGFQFVIAEKYSSKAALPAAVATAFMVLLGLILRRKFGKKSIPPTEPDYHI